RSSDGKSSRKIYANSTRQQRSDAHASTPPWQPGTTSKRWKSYMENTKTKGRTTRSSKKQKRITKKSITSPPKQTKNSARIPQELEIGRASCRERVQNTGVDSTMIQKKKRRMRIRRR